MSTEIKAACDVLVVTDGKVLMGKRKNCYGEGLYGLPGGHIEFGEKAIDAAKRELEEETGITGVDLEFITIVDNLRPPYDHYVNLGFLLKDYQGEIKLMEPEKCEAWEYFDLKSLPENIFPPHRKHLDTYLKNTNYLY